MNVLAHGSSPYAIVTAADGVLSDGQKLVETADLLGRKKVVAWCECMSGGSPNLMSLVALNAADNILLVLARATNKSPKYYEIVIDMPVPYTLAWVASWSLGDHDDYVLAEIGTR